MTVSHVDVKIPNKETMEAIKDVETGTNYEDITLKDLKKVLTYSSN